MKGPSNPFPPIKCGPSLLVLAWAWFAVAKIIASFYYFSPSDSIFDLSFGFGPYVESLYKSGTFESCSNGICNHATRMPLMPALFALIGQLSTNLLAAALFKNLILSLIVFVSFRSLLRQQSIINPGAAAIWSIVCLGLSLALPVIKHAAYVHYEEGFLVELMFLWTISLLMAVQFLVRNDTVGANCSIVILCLMLAVAAFFIKSSMLFVLVTSLVIALLWSAKFRDLRVLSALCLCIIAVLAWGVRNKVVTDRFSVMTSWDGPNAYRGWSEEGFMLYPDVVLDRMFDSEIAYKADGETVAIKSKPGCEQFANEWACNDYYKSLASDWLVTHPSEALQFSLRKLYLFFVTIKKTPYTYTNDARSASDVSQLETVVTSAWLLIGRIFEVVMLGLMFLLWRKRSTSARALVLGVAAVNIAYASPFLIGFNYERHVTVYLVLVIVCVAVMLAELLSGPTLARDEAVFNS
jgi:hypothetical protein